ncbi:MAG: ABC transporter permease [Limnochordia bacterium]|nr:ABC transporter permease [Limnochordia bacterium]
MKQYLLQKTGGFLLTAIVVSILTFLVVQVLPGDPALLMLGTEGSPEIYARLRSEMDLDEPALERYVRWFWGFLSGEWGNSWRYSMPVQELAAGAFPLSLTLAFWAVMLALVVAIPSGIFMAVHPGNYLARLMSVTTQVGLGLPQFWVGLLLIQIFAVNLRLLPAGGNTQPLSLVLPVLTLALPRATILSRFMRVGMAEALQQEYVRAARAKGLSRFVVVYKHALRNGVLAVFTIAGLQFAQLLAGTIVVEQVFGLPGVGQLLLAGVFQRDLPLVQALVMVIVLVILFFDLAFDLGLGLLDPRIRYE